MTLSTVRVEPMGKGHVFWHARGMQAGCQQLPLVTIDCAALQATCRSMERHILVEPSYAGVGASDD